MQRGCSGLTDWIPGDRDAHLEHFRSATNTHWKDVSVDDFMYAAIRVIISGKAKGLIKNTCAKQVIDDFDKAWGCKKYSPNEKAVNIVEGTARCVLAELLIKVHPGWGNMAHSVKLPIDELRTEENHWIIKEIFRVLQGSIKKMSLIKGATHSSMLMKIKQEVDAMDPKDQEPKKNRKNRKGDAAQGNANGKGANANLEAALVLARLTEIISIPKS
jgi:hypothetical protein